MTAKKISIKWIEAILLIVIPLVHLGLGTFATSFIEGEREVRRPREETFIADAQLPLRQSEAAVTEAELKLLHSKIVDQKVELAKQSAKLESLRTGYPALTATNDSVADTSLRPETKAAFTQLQLEIDSTKRVLKDLNDELPAASQAAILKAIELNRAQESFHKDFERAQKAFQIKTRGIIFMTGLILSFAVLLAAGMFILYLNRKEQFGIRTRFVLWSGFAILLALTSYQAFQVAGTTVTVILVASIASMWALRNIKEEAG